MWRQTDPWAKLALAHLSKLVSFTFSRDPVPRRKKVVSVSERHPMSISGSVHMHIHIHVCAHMYMCMYMNTYMYMHIQKLWEGHVFCFYAKTSVFSCLPTVGFLVWGLQTPGFVPGAPASLVLGMDWVTPCLLWVSSMQTAHGGASWP